MHQYSEMNWERLVPFVLPFVAAVIVFFLNITVTGPMIQADEGSYLANAAALAGYQNDFASSYHSGYSIFIAPAFWVADTPQSIWTAIKAINAILFAVIVICLWLISKYLSPTSSSRNRFAAVALVSLYPMWVIMVGYSFAQIAFVPVFLLMFLAYLRSIRGGVGSWIILGVVSGFLYWIHPTAVMSEIAVIVGAAYVAWNRRSYAPFASLLLTIITMVFIYRYGITPWLHQQMTISGVQPSLHYPEISSLLTPLLSLDSIKEVIARTAGQFFYLSVGTVGLIWVGLFTLTTHAVRVSSLADDTIALMHRSVAVFVLISLVGSVALPVLMFSSVPEAQRLDHWMYGRYVEGVISPILLAGALTMSFRKALWSVPIAVICALLLSFGLDSYTHVARFNISAFWQDFWLREQGLWGWLVAGCALIIITAAVPRKIGMLLIAFIFSFSCYLQIKWHIAASDNAANRWSAALTIREQFAPGTCVGFDHSGIDSYNKHVFWFDFAFILFDYKLKRINFEQWLNTCDGPLFSYTKNMDDRGVEVYPIAVNPRGGPVAWMKGRPPEDSVYPMIVSNRSNFLPFALISGWHQLESTHVWSESKAQLKLPVPEKCRSGACSVLLSFSVYGASGVRPVEVIFGMDSSKDTSPIPPVLVHSTSPQKILVPLDGNRPVLNLDINIPDAISPHVLQGTHDKRVLGLALQSIELISSSQLFWQGGSHIPSQVGTHTGTGMKTDGRPGYLMFGPYQPMKAGEYNLQVTGKMYFGGDSVIVDVIDHKADKIYARFKGIGAQNILPTNVLLEKRVILDEDVDALEVRVRVDKDADLFIDGYTLRAANVEKGREGK